jgi:hypothetical protein
MLRELPVESGQAKDSNRPKLPVTVNAASDRSTLVAEIGYRRIREVVSGEA